MYIPIFQKVPIIKSVNHTNKWNSSLDPHIFGFISDMHISSKIPISLINTDLVIKLLNEANVEKILISGDIAENFLYRNSNKHGCQIEDDFISYKTIESKYPSDLFIVASGNHDEFAVESYNSSEHYILKYCNFYSQNKKYKNYDNFLISKVNYEDVEFFVMNPYHYPTVPAGLGFSTDITSEMLDKIETFLSSPSNSKSRVLIMHNPTMFTNSWMKSSSHKTLADILASSNLSLILCGDTHYKLIMHTKTALEIHAKSVKSNINESGYQFISIDNGGVNEQDFVLNKETPFAVLTYPVKKKFISDQTDFSYENFKQAEIRVVHFSENKNLNISVSCSIKNKQYNDKKTGFLEFQRIIRPNQSLYSTSLSKLCSCEKSIDNDINDSNEFRLVFSGDWNYETDFVSGNQVKLEDEILPHNLNRRKSIISVGIVCYIVLFFIWCPFPPLEYFNRISSWISGKRVQSIKNQIVFLDKLIGILFGFIVIKSRIFYNQSKVIRLTFFIFVLSPFFLPISLIKVGQKTYGIILLPGYYLNGFYLDLWGIQLTSYFTLFVLLPSTIIFSAISYFKQTKKIHFVFIIDFAVAFAQFFLIRLVIEKALFQTTSLFLAMISPLFAIIPAIIIILEIYQIWNLLKFIKIENETQFLCDT